MKYAYHTSHLWGEGRRQHGGETNDCAVIALMHALGVTYSEAHEWCRQHGRKNREGMFNAAIAHMLEGLSTRTSYRRATNGTSAGIVAGPRPTLARFVREHPTGTYYVRKSGHVFVVKDGIVYDNAMSGERSIILDAWLIDS